MNKLFGLGLFVVGAAGGYYIGYTITKKKYETLADEEVESVKKTFKHAYEDRIKQLEEKLGVEGVNDIHEEKKEEKKLVRSVTTDANNIPLDEKEGYFDYAAQYAPENDGRVVGDPTSINILSGREISSNKSIYIINPEEFSESTNQTITLYYYKDYIVADDDYNILDNVAGTIGENTLDQFNLQDVDCLYIRNEDQEIDYEVLLDERLYSKVAPRFLVREPSDDTEIN